MGGLITIFCVLENGEKLKIEINPNKAIRDLIEIIKREKNFSSLILYFKDKELNSNSTIFQSGLRDNENFFSKNEIYKNDDIINIEEKNSF